MYKQAKISYSKLKAMLEDNPALFSMVSPENQEAFLENPELLSAFDAVRKGKASSVEGSLGAMRGKAKMPTIPFTEVDGKTRIPLTNLIQDSEGDYTRLNPRRTVAGASVDNPKQNLKNLAEISAGRISDGGGKNWNTISLGERPLRAYGDVGLMTSPALVDYPIHSSIKKPGTINIGGVGENEHFFTPKAIRDEHGITTDIELPSAQGFFVYDPKKVDRKTAKNLKEKGGIALNARLRRLVKAYNKERMGDLSPENTGLDNTEYKKALIKRHHPDIPEYGGELGRFIQSEEAKEKAEELKLLDQTKKEVKERGMPLLTGLRGPSPEERADRLKSISERKPPSSESSAEIPSMPNFSEMNKTEQSPEIQRLAQEYTQRNSSPQEKLLPAPLEQSSSEEGVSPQSSSSPSSSLLSNPALQYSLGGLMGAGIGRGLGHLSTRNMQDEKKRKKIKNISTAAGLGTGLATTYGLRNLR